MLDRPIVVFDLETTGKDFEKDRVIQLAFLKYDSLDSETPCDKLVSYINPDGTPIHEEAQAVHGISAEDLEDAPKFAEIADEVREFIGDCALSGYNIRAFDIPMLTNEFVIAGHKFNWIMDRPIIDSRTLWLQYEPRTLAGALLTFCGTELENAHDADADTMATADVLRAQLKQYGLESGTWADVEKAEDPEERNKNVIGSKNRLQKKDGKLLFLFGKHKGKNLVDVVQEDRQYLEWILKGNFEITLKVVIRKVIEAVDAAARARALDD
jgi:DNA polymerase-3 subunit epsilon